MSSNNWVCIYASAELFKAKIAKDILKEDGIKSVVVDKKDSAYGTFGEIELYVQGEFVIKAKHILEKQDF